MAWPLVFMRWWACDPRTTAPLPQERGDKPDNPKLQRTSALPMPIAIAIMPGNIADDAIPIGRTPANVA
jgi:hypothetical protein